MAAPNVQHVSKTIEDYTLARFNPQEMQWWLGLGNDFDRKEFLKEYFKKHFDALVWLLGYRDLGSFHTSQIQALSQVREISDTQVRKLWLWSRGFFKTSLITESHSIYLIINNPNIRILLVSNTISVAQDILRNIKNHLMTNVQFRYFFEDFCPEPNSVGKIEFGTEDSFTIKARTRPRKEPTMMVAGIGTNLTGQHYDYIKCDDLVTKDSVSNESQIQASKDYYASLRHLFDKAAVPREDVVGTIYHFNDLYSSVLMKMPDFNISFIPARVGGTAVFPERLNDESIDKLIADPSVGPYQFQTQYMLNPINPSAAKFKEEWLKYYGTKDEPLPSGLAEYILVDPASTIKKKSDYTVIERWGVDSRGKTYLLEGVRDKIKSFQRIDLLFQFVSKAKNLKWVSYEVIGGRHGDLEIIEQRQKKEAIWFPVKETKASTNTKVDRIEQRLVGQYHAGNVLLPTELYYVSKFDGKVHNFIQELKLEYLQFPFTEHDDILDCQAQLFEEKLIVGKKEEVRKETRTGVTADEWDKMYEEIEREKNKRPGLSSEQIQHLIFSRKLGNKLRSQRWKK
jgi:predicted phage terminase large subunit-like protein